MPKKSRRSTSSAMVWVTLILTFRQSWPWNTWSMRSATYLHSPSLTTKWHQLVATPIFGIRGLMLPRRLWTPVMCQGPLLFNYIFPIRPTWCHQEPLSRYSEPLKRWLWILDPTKSFGSLYVVGIWVSGTPKVRNGRFPKVAANLALASAPETCNPRPSHRFFEICDLLAIQTYLYKHNLRFETRHYFRLLFKFCDSPLALGALLVDLVAFPFRFSFYHSVSSSFLSPFGIGNLYHIFICSNLGYSFVLFVMRLVTSILVC